MTAGDFAAVVVTICVIVGMSVLLFVLYQLIHVLRDLRAAAERLSSEAVPAIADLRATADIADAELERLHGVIDTAEHMSAGLASAGRRAGRVVTTPAIKTRALAAGASSAWHRLLRRNRRP